MYIFKLLCLSEMKLCNICFHYDVLYMSASEPKWNRFYKEHLEAILVLYFVQQKVLDAEKQISIYTTFSMQHMIVSIIIICSL